MVLDSKKLADVLESDIQELIANGVLESREIDYKEQLKIGSDGDKKEFLYDVSSFANAGGGHLLIGVAESEGRPTEIKPLTIANWDAERLKIENLLRDGISPRIAPEMTTIAAQSGHVIALRIPRSWSGPHMVSLQHTNKFYSRNSGGKYLLDVGELRTAFTSGAQIADGIRTFRQNRLSSIVSNQTPVDLPETAKLIVHCCPYASGRFGNDVDIRKAYDKIDLIAPLYGGFSHHYNLDGVMSFCSESQGRAVSYFQLFRNGNIEYVDAALLKPKEQIGKVIPSTSVAAACISSLQRALTLLGALYVVPPAALMVTMLGVKSYKLGVGLRRSFDTVLIDRDALVLTPAIAQSFDIDATAFLRPILDEMWNAAGMSACRDYDAFGKPTNDLVQALQGRW